MPLHFPAVQFVHTDEVVAPAVTLRMPARQSVQTEAPMPLHVPLPQGLHTDAVVAFHAALHIPAVQFVQKEASIAALHFPGWHG